VAGSIVGEGLGVVGRGPPLVGSVEASVVGLFSPFDEQAAATTPRAVARTRRRARREGRSTGTAAESTNGGPTPRRVDVENA